MEHTTKMEVSPQDMAGVYVPLKKKAPMSPTEKLLRIIKVVLKLATVDGYDGEGRVKNRYGEAISGSSVVVLLNHAMSYGHPPIGEDAFIAKLKEAAVDDDD